jgi:hypothetical protein
MPHTDSGNYYGETFLDLLIVAIMASAMVGTFLSAVLAVTRLTLGWPHDLRLACSIAFAVPAAIVFALGNVDD